jgi:hypothetical protein
MLRALAQRRTSHMRVDTLASFRRVRRLPRGITGREQQFSIGTTDAAVYLPIRGSDPARMVLSEPIAAS